MEKIPHREEFENLLAKQSEELKTTVNESKTLKEKEAETKDEIFGWYGTAAIVIAYALVSNSFISSTGYIFQLLNLTGALGIIWISYKKNVYQSVVLNIIWSIIAIVAIIRILI